MDSVLRQLNRESGLTPTRYRPAQHGTHNEYYRHKCRCDECRTFVREQGRKYRDPVRNREAVKRNQRANIALMRSLKAKPCADCGVQYAFYVMQFDHLGDKQFSLASGEARSIGKQTLIAEAAKCEVVCANCHAERTFQRRTAANKAAA